MTDFIAQNTTWLMGATGTFLGLVFGAGITYGVMRSTLAHVIQEIVRIETEDKARSVIVEARVKAMEDKCTSVHDTCERDMCAKFTAIDIKLDLKMEKIWGRIDEAVKGLEYMRGRIETAIGRGGG